MELYDGQKMLFDLLSKKNNKFVLWIDHLTYGWKDQQL